MKLWSKLRALLRKDKLDAEMTEEMRLHVEMQTERNVAAGMNADDARYAARREFGAEEQIKELCRDERGWPWMENSIRDVRFTLRGLRKAPGFSLGVIVTLALGIGFSIIAFSFIDLVTRSPLRLPQSERLVRIWSAADGNRSFAPATSWPLYERILERPSTFASAGAMVITGFTYLDGDTSTSVGGTRVTSSLLSTLGAPLLRGRLFTPAEEAPGGPPVVLLAPGFWRNALGGGEDAIGKMIVLDGIPHEVVGIVDDAVIAPDPGNAVLLPRPFELPGVTLGQVERGAFTVQVTARLQPGVSIEQANAELQSIKASYRESFPDNADVARDVFLRSYADEISSGVRPVAVWLMAAALCVLLIAISNAAGLCITRTLRRRQDTGIRLALGGSATRVLSVLIGEVALLVMTATALALMLAQWTLPIAERFARPFLQRLAPLEFGPAAWVAAGGSALLALAVLVIIPLVHVMRTTASNALRPNRTATVGGKAQGALVTLQVAITFSLLIASAVLLASYRTLSATSPGFDSRGVMTGFVNLPAQQYRTPEQQVAFFNQVIDGARAADPSLEIALVTTMPLTRELRGSAFHVAGRPVPPENQRPVAIQRGVSDEFFRVMRIPLREGRVFRSDDRAPGRSVGVINESFARRLFGAESAVGKMLIAGGGAGAGIEVVGVIGDVRANGLVAGATDEIYRPFQRGAQVAFAIRSSAEPARVRAVLVEAIKAVDAQRALAVFQTSEQFLSRSSSSQRMVAWTTGVFAAAAIILAAVGLYGLVACWVEQRTREFGVRMALGAKGADIQRLMLSRGMKCVAAGIAGGAVVYLAATRAVGRIVFGVSAVDPVVIAAVAVGLVAIALLACYLPARRAAKVDPMVALRSE